MFKPVLFFLSLSFVSCTADGPKTLNASLQAERPKSGATAPNVTAGKRCIVALYEQAQFALYLDGNGASALIVGETHEIGAEPFEVQPGEWLASNPATGDYILMNTVTGATQTKIKGRYFAYLPKGEN